MALPSLKATPYVAESSAFVYAFDGPKLRPVMTTGWPPTVLAATAPAPLNTKICGGA